MTCRELVELVTEYFEGTLPAAERRELEAHLALCPGCVTYVEQMRTTLRLVRDTAALEERPEVAGLLEAFRDFKRERSSIG